MSEVTSTPLREIPFTAVDGSTARLSDYDDKVVLIVNVASKCGFTPQYEQLEQLQATYGPRGFTVLGFPCNQFMHQEPGTMAEIIEFCTATYGVTFPIFEKIKVNGKNAHPLYQTLKKTADAEGTSGRIGWNFEKFLLTPGGTVHRYRSKVRPDAPEIVQVIEQNLPA